MGKLWHRGIYVGSAAVVLGAAVVGAGDNLASARNATGHRAQAQCGGKSATAKQAKTRAIKQAKARATCRKALKRARAKRRAAKRRAAGRVDRSARPTWLTGADAPAPEASTAAPTLEGPTTAAPAPAAPVVAAESGASAETANPDAAAARERAEALIAEVVLPDGAVEVESDPASPPELESTPMTHAGGGGPAPYEPVGGTAPQPAAPHEFVYEHRFWRVPGEPQQVLDQIRENLPGSFRLYGTMGVGENGAPVNKTLVMAFTSEAPPAASNIHLEELQVSVAPAEAGGTALRVDGVVGYVPSTPAPA